MKNEERGRKCGFLPAIIGLSCLIASCGGNQPQNNVAGMTIIDLETALTKPEGELKLSDLYASVRYVPLETNDSCLIGSYPSLLAAGNEVVVSSSAQGLQCHSFDRQTGRFITRIGHTGEDPQAYSSYPNYNGQDGLLYFPREPDKLQKYDTKGHYHGVVKLPTKFPMPAKWAFNDSLIVGSLKNRWPSVSSCALLSFGQDGQLKDSIFDPHATAGYDTIKADYGRIDLQALAGNVHMAVTTFGTDVAWNSINGGSLYAYGNEIKYYGDFADTVYVLKGGRLQPSIAFHTGKLHFPLEGRTRRTGVADKVLITGAFETPTQVIFYCARNVYGDEPETYRGVYDRRTGATRLTPDNGELEDDLTHFLPYGGRPLEAYRVVEWLAAHPEAKKNPALAPLLKVQEEDNPVAVITD